LHTCDDKAVRRLFVLSQSAGNMFKECALEEGQQDSWHCCYQPLLRALPGMPNISLG